ncbi:TetR/AcrR family transcriptional regulator [Streptomyces sp. NA02950]|uniref:TetR/AcrR family transcriptional regulator n=1 Tax=Streptomyces sp. NA02950 TaxID=2742137 RepID=UPI0015903C9F|nr:TetR family transcriptional regulator [Streptomyces sp. NA02950]QKV90528.1 TetR/AcrR family transcriptional regulator [Streptomyces sp. NA02950]
MTSVGNERGSRPKAHRRRGRPTGARAGDPGTRDRILATARAEFSERGYDKTSIRAIAKAAGVDSALVHHYFGTKEQVFAAAIEESVAPALASLSPPAGKAAASPGTAGERLTRSFFGMWENSAARQPLLAILRSAVGNETAAAIFRRMIVSQLMRRVAGELDAPDSELRVELAAAQLVGIAMLRYVIKIEPLASEDTERIIHRVVPVVQRHLTGD